MTLPSKMLPNKRRKTGDDEVGIELACMPCSALGDAEVSDSGTGDVEMPGSASAAASEAVLDELHAVADLADAQALAAPLASAALEEAIVGAPGSADCQIVSASSIDVESMTDEERKRWKKKKWVWCHDCGGGSINKAGWTHKELANHNVASLKDAGKIVQAQQEFLFLDRYGAEAKSALVHAKLPQFLRSRCRNCRTLMS